MARAAGDGVNLMPSVTALREKLGSANAHDAKPSQGSKG